MTPYDYFRGNPGGGFPIASVVLVVCNTLWLVARRVRIFADPKPQSALGRLGIVVVPVRFVAKVGAKLFGFLTIGMFVTAAEIDSLNIAILAAFAGFAVAYGINYAISRCEQRIYPREQNAPSS